MSAEETTPVVKNLMFDVFIASARAGDRAEEFESKIRDIVKSKAFKTKSSLASPDTFEMIDPVTGKPITFRYKEYSSLAIDYGNGGDPEDDEEELEELLDEIVGFTWYSFVDRAKPDVTYFGPVDDNDLIDLLDVQSAGLLADKADVDVINTLIGVIYDPKEQILFPEQ